MADALQWPQVTGARRDSSPWFLSPPQALLTRLPKHLDSSSPHLPASSLVTIVSWLEVHSGLQTSLSASLLSFQNPFSLQKPEQSWTNISDCVMLSHLPPACLRQRKASSGFPVKPKLLPLCDGWLYVSVGSGKKIALPFQSVEGLNTTKGRGGRKSPLLFLPHCLSWDSSRHLLLSLDWDSHHQLSWFSDLRTWTERHLQLSWVSRKPADLFL